MREIWLVDSRERWVQVWQRAEDAWIVTLPLRGDAVFASKALGRPRSSSTPSTATPGCERQRGLTSSAPTAFASGSPRSNAAMLRQRRVGDRGQRLAR